MERISLRTLVRLGVATLAMLALTSFGAVSQTSAQEEIIVTINELNGSGVSGDATLTDNGDGTTTIDVLVDGATGDHPIHLHSGTCAELGDVVVPLTNVDASGASVTDVPIALTTILEEGPHAINIHLSADEIQTYIACGDVVSDAVQPVQEEATPVASPVGGTTVVTDIGSSGVGSTSGGNMGFLALAAAAAALIVVSAGFGLRRKESRG